MLKRHIEHKLKIIGLWTQADREGKLENRAKNSTSSSRTSKKRLAVFLTRFLIQHHSSTV
jgi:hypothetical protein